MLCQPQIPILVIKFMSGGQSVYHTPILIPVESGSTIACVTGSFCRFQMIVLDVGIREHFELLLAVRVHSACVLRASGRTLYSECPRSVQVEGYVSIIDHGIVQKWLSLLLNILPLRYLSESGQTGRRKL